MVKNRQTVRLPPTHRKPDAASANTSSKSPTENEAVPVNLLSPQTLRKTLGTALPLLTLAALTSPVSQASLAPVYGSIPSSVNHVEAITATMLLGYLWRVFLHDTHSWPIHPYLALWAFWMPLAQSYLNQYSSALGPVAGPIVAGFLSCHSLLMPSAYAAAQALEPFALQDRLGNIAGAALPAILLDLCFFRPTEYLLSHYALPWATVALPAVFTPVKAQLLIGVAYTLLSDTKPYWLFSLAFPPVLLAFLANPHFDSAHSVDRLNLNLAPLNWTLLDRAWSTTGYLSVLESQDQHYRVLRSDHSLLGGEWQLTDARRRDEGWLVNEPIYAVFEMLEAVRLVEVTPPVPDNAAQALVIGLGIGTAPKALMAHGINTTIVELDPVVHRYAQRYFGLPPTTTHLEDAVTWVDARATLLNSTSTSASGQRYDYILHDVFTSGIEPLSLFTLTFLTQLRSLLTPNGVIALNYAGDLRSDLTTTALNTISQAFAGQCKIYRDAPAPAESSTTTTTTTTTTDEDTTTSTNSHPDAPSDFLNLLLFCRNTPGPITFRAPTSRDFLGSKSRRHYLLPREDYAVEFPPHPAAGNQSRLSSDVTVLRKGEESAWRKLVEEGAIRHWYIMRSVLPSGVWEMW
ncbi:hypothetical protein LTR08_006835 [Meristemomyces frigidus]|nr:hypothetical protein LTR08_006835 [Meristemomyces frigidus]